MKDIVEIAEIMKGVAHPRRVRLMMAMKGSRSSLSLDELSDKADVPYKTASVHVASLVSSGLVDKTRYGQRVEHSLTELGKEIMEFMTRL